MIAIPLLSVALLAVPHDRPPRADFTVTASDYRLALPATVNAGWRTVRFRNAGREFHHVVFLRLRNAAVADSALAALASRKGDRDGRVPGTTSVGGVEGADPPPPGTRGHAPETYGVVGLEPGEYLVLCMIPGADGVMHVNRGMHALLHVVRRSRDANAPLPTPDLTVREGDYSYRLSSATVARGWRLIAVMNDGPAEHVSEVVRMRPGRHAADLFRAGAADPIEASVGGVPRLAPGARGYAWVHLAPGAYVIQCPLTSAAGWQHAARGMVAEFTVR